MIPDLTEPKAAVLVPPEERPALGPSLARWIGRPAGEWRTDDLVRVFLERRLRLLALLHVGGDGELKTLDFAPRDAEHLRRLLEGGERADGSSLFPGTGITAGASDVFLRPRPATAFLDPFSPLPTLAVLCGHVGKDGAPLPQSPDTIVRRALERLERQTGCGLLALGEVEYFLGRPKDGDGGRGREDLGYHATAPFVFGEALRRRALGVLADLGVAVKYGHAEVGFVPADDGERQVWEQHEIELDLAPLPAAADAIALTRWVLRRLAQAADLELSLEPVLRAGHAGNGLHVHFAPVAFGELKPVHGASNQGTLASPARWLVGGLVRHGAALMAFGNRAPSSFARLAQGREAPHGVTWGESDRGALVRVPVVAHDAAGHAMAAETVEFRLPDGSAHPHLLLAGVAQAMCDAYAATDLECLVAGAAADRAAANGAAAPAGVPRAAALPKSRADVAAALKEARATLEAGGVFPRALLDSRIERLGG